MRRREEHRRRNEGPGTIKPGAVGKDVVINEAADVRVSVAIGNAISNGLGGNERQEKNSGREEGNSKRATEEVHGSVVASGPWNGKAIGVIGTTRRSSLQDRALVPWPARRRRA